jgi:SAM-dependent methyltransferase
MAELGSPTSSRGNEAYLFPRHATEIDRLDIQHYAFREALGANHLAPIGRPARILDSGSGTGQWAFDLCAEQPQASVFGLDVELGKAVSPQRYNFVRANLLDGLPFSDEQFDFVHQRLLAPAIPLKAWAAVISELVRVTRPGGWIELLELDWAVQPAGQATQRILDLMGRLGRSRGLDTTGIIFRSLDQCLRRESLTDVVRRPFEIGLGEWDGRAGSLLLSDYRSGMTRLGPVLQPHVELSADEYTELVRASLDECESLHSRFMFAIAYGRKPRASAGARPAPADPA